MDDLDMLEGIMDDLEGGKKEPHPSEAKLEETPEETPEEVKQFISVTLIFSLLIYLFYLYENNIVPARRIEISRDTRPRHPGPGPRNGRPRSANGRPTVGHNGRPHSVITMFYLQFFQRSAMFLYIKNIKSYSFIENMADR